jgi:proline iminopeptidase
MTPFSVLENYYMANECFLPDDQLLRNADKISHIPTFIVNGRYDAICPPQNAYALGSKPKTVKMEFPLAAHSDQEPRIAEAMKRGVEWVSEQIAK